MKWPQHFSHYVYRIFSRRSRAANHDRICPNFELIRDFIADLVTWKNEEDLRKNEGAIAIAP